MLRKELKVAPVEGCSEVYLEDLQLPSTGVSSGRVAGWMGANNLRVDYNGGGGLDHRGHERRQEGWKQTSFPRFPIQWLYKILSYRLANTSRGHRKVVNFAVNHEPSLDICACPRVRRGTS